ncbi:DNA repair protein RadA [Marispirochaeta aestuarii]|uniref:DNA repair protein RadA n=1 Tax=Marispirochaeta aestuarii TaxID=1963862 RepID=UPI0029C98568|nr:DNA repair protein RadA [Marispirochaeta aestuarii]
MKKNAVRFVCSSCGHVEAKWLGRCPSCGEWNTLTEESASPREGKKPSSRRTAHQAEILSRIPEDAVKRLDTGIPELNQVLGGGMVPGSSVLIGGQPGIGKSTLLLQVSRSVRCSGTVLYISGEESPRQIAMRARRIGAASDSIKVLCETDVTSLLRHMEAIQPALVVVDSIQTLICEELGPVPGTVNQIKYGSHEVSDWCREHQVPLFLVAHVTKEGSIAGPKVVEHMVDAVLYFEEAEGGIRLLRAMKNRFGPVNELGIFSMEERGLIGVDNPSSLFLQNREGGLPPGAAVAPVYEGSRVLLVEIQALTVPAKSGISRTFADRIDSRRVSRIAAVLEKHVGLRFSDQDLYVNVAGGIRLDEVGIDLPLAVALYSARTGLAAPEGTVFAGEVSLAGEVRPVPQAEMRSRAAEKLGFSARIGPGRDGKGKSLRSLKETLAELFSAKQN